MVWRTRHNSSNWKLKGLRSQLNVQRLDVCWMFRHLCPDGDCLGHWWAEWIIICIMVLVYHTSLYMSQTYHDLTIWWLLWKMSGHHITNETTSKPLYYVSRGLKSWVSEIVDFPSWLSSGLGAIDWPHIARSHLCCGVIPSKFLLQSGCFSVFWPLPWIFWASMSLHQILGRKDIIIYGPHYFNWPKGSTNGQRVTRP